MKQAVSCMSGQIVLVNNWQSSWILTLFLDLSLFFRAFPAGTHAENFCMVVSLFFPEVLVKMKCGWLCVLYCPFLAQNQISLGHHLVAHPVNNGILDFRIEIYSNPVGCIFGRP